MPRYSTPIPCRPASRRALRANFAPAGEPAALEIAPAIVQLDGPRATCQLVVTGRTADGKRLDLTADAAVDPCDLIAAAAARIPQGGEGRLRATHNPRRRADRTSSCRCGECDGGPAGRLPARGRRGHERRRLQPGACHGTPNGKNGFRLSLRGSDPAADYLALTREQFGRRTDRLDRRRA